MSRLKKYDFELKDSIDMGKRSKLLIPKIKNWCSNIKIQSQYGGLMGEMGLPTMNTISCSEFHGDSAMNLEWIASDFIKDHCPNCKFHKEINPNNVGRKVLADYEKRKKQEKISEEYEQKTINNLNNKLEALIEDKKDTKTTELSILKLLLSLNNSKTNKIQKALEILEASCVSPEFFNSDSLDYLTIYFKDKEIRETILHTAYNVVSFDEDSISAYFLETVFNNLRLENYVEDLIKLIQFNKFDKDQIFSLIPILIQKYDLSSFDRTDYFENHSPYIISFFYNLFLLNDKKFYDTVKVYIKEENTHLRANVTLILFQLFYVKNIIGFKLIAELIKALNIHDDGSPKSADYIILKTLFHFSEINPEKVFNSINNEVSKLNYGGKIEVIKFYKLFVLQTVNNTHEVYITIAIDELLKTCSNKNLYEKIRTESIDSIKRISQDKPNLLLDKVDSVISALSQSIINKTTFKWYLKDLDNSSLTFNPLKGKNFYDINSEEIILDNEIGSLKITIKNLLKFNQTELFKKLCDIIKNTNVEDKNNVQLKLYFIEIIRDGVNDSILLTSILPDLHTWLLDFKNPELRIEALKLLEKLLRDNFHIIPKTIFSLLVIFIDDHDRLIKSYAINCYYEILKNDIIPEEDEINIILNLFDSKYLIIHQSATVLTTKLINIINDRQKTSLIASLLSLLRYYHNESKRDFKFCMKLLGQIVFISHNTKNIQSDKTESFLIKNFLTDYCDQGDYYDSLEALNKLTQFKLKNSDYNEVWLKHILKFTYRFRTNKFEPFIRSDKYNFLVGIFSISSDHYLGQIDFIKTNVKNLSVQTDAFYDELIFTLFHFSFFNLNEDILELIEFIELKIKRTNSLSYLFNKLDVFKNLSKLNLLDELSLSIEQKKELIDFEIDYKNEVVVIQCHLAQKRILLLENFKINDLDKVLIEKEYFDSSYTKLSNLSENTEEEVFFTNFKYLNTSIFLFIEWVYAILNGDDKAESKLKASKLNIILIDLEYFSYLPQLKNQLFELSKSINGLFSFGEKDIMDIIISYRNLRIPYIHHLREIGKTPYKFHNNEKEIIKNEVYVLSLELYLKNNPWANPQILKPKELYTISGTVKLNKIPNGFKILRIQPSTTNSSIFELNIEAIDLNDNLNYQIKGNILFNFPQSDIEDLTSIKLIPYFSNEITNLCPTIIGYDELITKILDEKNEIFRTGFDMMNKKVHELYNHSYFKQLDNLDKSNLMVLLNGITNYQGYCLQSGKYKGVSSKKESEFRDELIQHLVSNPNIGEKISKESEVAGGKVEISYYGIVAELKVEKKLSERSEMIKKYSNQALSYSSGSSKLVSIVCILDLTEKTLPPSPGVNNIIINSVKTHGFSKDEPEQTPFQIFIFIDGNTINPSVYSKQKR